jgi:glucose/arabinose dehydrogenase
MLGLLALAAAAAVAPHDVATDLHVPWGIAFLPNGDALVGERTTAKILRLPKGGGAPRTVRRLKGVDVNAGEGGLLGLAVSPHYRRDHRVYAYYTSAGDNRIVRFKLHGPQHVILKGIKRASFHDGGRLAFGPDGKLYAGVGDAGNTQDAQNRHALNGKILRINPNGSIPKSNPFNSPVWSYGHRNVQGLAFDRKGRLWATEFGQDTTDEVNLIRRGHNYGWPDVEGTGDTQNGKYTNPKVTWTPTSTASPSGAAIVGRRLYVGALQCECVFRIPLKGTTAGSPTKLYDHTYGRVRTVIRTPAGRLWLATSNRDGRGTPRPGDDRVVETGG